MGIKISNVLLQNDIIKNWFFNITYKDYIRFFPKQYEGCISYINNKNLSFFMCFIF